VTFDQVREKLGFMPFDEYLKCPKRLSFLAIHQKGCPYDISHRCTGATTKMICHLLSDLSECTHNELFYISGRTPLHAKRIVELAWEHAIALGLDHHRIKPIEFARRYSKKSKLIVFRDHC